MITEQFELKLSVQERSFKEVEKKIQSVTGDVELAVDTADFESKIDDATAGLDVLNSGIELDLFVNDDDLELSASKIEDFGEEIDLDVFVNDDEAEELISKLDSINSEIDLDLFVDDEEVDSLQGKIDGISDKSISITADSSDYSTAIDSIESEVISDKELNIMALDFATNILNEIEGLDLSDKEFQLVAEDIATDIVTNLKDNIESIPDDKDVTITTDTTDSTKAITDLTSIIDGGLLTSIKSTATAFITTATQGVTAFTALAGGIGGTSGALGILKVALASTGVGLLVVALGSLIAFFTQTQEGADLLKQATDALGAVFAVLVDRASDLGRTLVEAISNPKEAIQDLGNLLKGFLLDQVDKVLSGFQGLGTAIKLIFEGEFEQALEVGSESLQKFGEVAFSPIIAGANAVSGAFADIGEEIATEAASAADLAKRLQDINVVEKDLILTQAKRRAEIKRLRFEAEDESNSLADRIKSLERANQITLDIFQDEKKIAVERAAISKAQNALGESSLEELKEMEQLQARVVDLDGEEFDLKKSLQRRLNTLTNERDRANGVADKSVIGLEALKQKQIELSKQLEASLFAGNIKEAEDYKLKIEEVSEQIADFQLRLLLLGKDVPEIDLSSIIDQKSGVEIGKEFISNIEKEFDEIPAPEIPELNFDNTLAENFRDTLLALGKEDFTFDNLSDSFKAVDDQLKGLAESGAVNFDLLSSVGIKDLGALNGALEKSFETLSFLTDGTNQELSDYAKGLGEVAGLLSQSLEEGTALQKAAAITQAIINSYLAFTQVLKDEKLNTLAKIPLAAVILGSGLAQVSKIAGANKGVIGITDKFKGKADHTDTIPLLVAKGESVISTKGTNINKQALELANKGVNLSDYYRNVYNSTTIDLRETNDLLYNLNRKIGNTKVIIKNASGSNLKARVTR